MKGSPAHPAPWIWISQGSNKDQRAKILPFLVPHLTASETMVEVLPTLVAGAWTERKKIFHGGSFLKLADDNMDIQNPEAQNRECPNRE